MRPSYSSENILLDSPPPKPPLPNRHTDPPPLPPKRRPSTSTTRTTINTTSSTPTNNYGHELDSATDPTFLHCTPDRNSLRSRSPEDNSSLLSASAGSLDSALNHSREEEELKNLTLDTSHDELHSTSDISLIKQSVSQSEATHDWSDEAESVQPHSGNTGDGVTINHRNSNESGFVSIRSSTQSMSTKHVSSSSTTSTTTLLQQQQNISAAAAISNVIRKFDAISEQNAIALASSKAASAAYTTTTTKLENGSTLEALVSKSHVSHTTITAKEVTDGLEALNVNMDEVFGHISDGNEEKPPLPEKTRKTSARRVSTYDNVDETDAAELR